MDYNKTHPVYVKRGATSPRNQKTGPASITSADRTRDYAQRARAAGKTVGDILAECRMQELIRKHVNIKT